MKEILKQAAKATKASQSQPKQAKASKRKQKQAIEPARAWVQNEFHCNKEHQPKSCKNLPKTPQQPRIVHKGPEWPRMLANSSQTFPKPSKTIPKSSQNPLKSNQNPSQTAPRALLKTTPHTSMKKRVSKTTLKAPRASKPVPKLPPNPPKWSPRRPQIRFLKAFLAWFFPIANLHRFFAAFLQNLRGFSKADLQISCAHAMFRGPPQRLTLFEKITRNHRKIFPKSFPNPSQNLEKSIQNRKKSLQKRKIT